MYTVKRIFGGFAVVDADGVEVKTFKGQGAKSKAETSANGLGTDIFVVNPSETTGGRGNHGRGGRGRGNF